MLKRSDRREWKFTPAETTNNKILGPLRILLLVVFSLQITHRNMVIIVL